MKTNGRRMKKGFFEIVLLLFVGCSVKVNAQFDIPPRFPGGERKMMEFMRDNLTYPADAKEQGIEGRVILRFVITETGKLDNIQVQRPLSPSCDREAVRIVEAMPVWSPGTLNGNPVRVYYTLPVVFDLKARQEEHPVAISALQDSIPVNRAVEIIDCVETPPQFPEGDRALMRYIKERTYYPNPDVCV
jgi:TonB family protein